MASTKSRKKVIKKETAKQPPEETKEEIIEVTKDMQKYLADPLAFTVNTSGKTPYECIGITYEELACFDCATKQIMRKSVPKAVKVQELYNLIVSDKRYIAMLIWLTPYL